ncbi:MAG: MFS transporter [Janthinobacterium lividum]
MSRAPSHALPDTLPAGLPGTPPSHSADKASRIAAMTLGLCLPADTLLYLILPLYSEAFGVTIAQAGLLLAANRLVRIFGYSHVVRFYARRGDRPVCLLAAGTAAVCALGYATLTGFWWLLPIRLAWGLSFAALNLSTQVLSTADPQGAARRTGRSRAVISMGPALALPLGAVLCHWWGPRAIFFLLFLTAVGGVFVARALPAVQHPMPAAGGRRWRWPDSLAVWSFVEGVVLDGLFIFGLALHAQTVRPHSAVLVAGALLALRYISELTLSPLGGQAAHRWGAVRMLVIFSLLTSVALVGFGFDWLLVGGACVMLLRAMQLTLVAPVVALRNPGLARLPALAGNAMWRDLGAGTGPLIAGLLLPVASAATVYAVAGVALAASALATGFSQKG